MITMRITNIGRDCMYIVCDYIATWNLVHQVSLVNKQLHQWIMLQGSPTWDHRTLLLKKTIPEDTLLRRLKINKFVVTNSILFVQLLQSYDSVTEAEFTGWDEHSLTQFLNQKITLENLQVLKYDCYKRLTHVFVSWNMPNLTWLEIRSELEVPAHHRYKVKYPDKERDWILRCSKLEVLRSEQNDVDLRSQLPNLKSSIVKPAFNETNPYIWAKSSSVMESLELCYYRPIAAKNFMDPKQIETLEITGFDLNTLKQISLVTSGLKRLGLSALQRPKRREPDVISDFANFNSLQELTMQRLDLDLATQLLSACSPSLRCLYIGELESEGNHIAIPTTFPLQNLKELTICGPYQNPSVCQFLQAVVSSCTNLASYCIGHTAPFPEDALQYEITHHSFAQLPKSCTRSLRSVHVHNEFQPDEEYTVLTELVLKCSSFECTLDLDAILRKAPNIHSICVSHANHLILIPPKSEIYSIDRIELNSTSSVKSIDSFIAMLPWLSVLKLCCFGSQLPALISTLNKRRYPMLKLKLTITHDVDLDITQMEALLLRVDSITLRLTWNVPLATNLMTVFALFQYQPHTLNFSLNFCTDRECSKQMCRDSLLQTLPTISKLSDGERSRVQSLVEQDRIPWMNRFVELYCDHCSYSNNR